MNACYVHGSCSLAHLQVAAVVHLGTERSDVTVGTKLGKTMTFDPHCCLWEVEMGGVCQLDCVRAVEVGESHRQARRDPKLC